MKKKIKSPLNCQVVPGDFVILCLIFLPEGRIMTGVKCETDVGVFTVFHRISLDIRKLWRHSIC